MPGLAQAGIPGDDFLKKIEYKPINVSLAGGNLPRFGSNDQLGAGSQDALGIGSGTGGAGGFDWGNAMSNFSMGAEGVMGLANAYSAYKQLGLMEDQLGMQKASYNKDIANQATLTNDQLRQRAVMEAQAFSDTDPNSAEFQEEVAARQVRVDGSPI